MIDWLGLLTHHTFRARVDKVSVGLSNFAMGTILGKVFAQAQVHTEFIAQVPKGMRIHTDFNKRLFVWHLILNQSK